MQVKIYIDPDGVEYGNIPKIWKGATNLNDRWLLAHGWTIRHDDAPTPPRRYSQYRLHKALETRGLWEPFWASLADSQRTYWYEAQDLASDDPNFASGLEAAASMADADTLAEILAEAEV